MSKTFTIGEIADALKINQVLVWKMLADAGADLALDGVAGQEDVAKLIAMRPGLRNKNFLIDNLLGKKGFESEIEWGMIQWPA